MRRNHLVAVLESLGSLSSDGYVLYNRKTKKVEYINRPLIDLFDISHQAFTHQTEFFINHIVENDITYLQGQLEILFVENRVENVEFSTKSHDGTVKSISASGYMVAEGKFVVGVFRDITKSREHENYIINYGAKKNTLLDMVTHNLSGPLNIAKNLVESLENSVSANDIPNIHAHVHLIRENTSHCIQIVNDFLEEEHLVSPNISVKRNRFEVLSKINTILERIRKSYPDFDFKVISTVESLNVNADDVKFLQAVNNLISNAVKWSQPNQVIKITITENAEHFYVSVQDNGIGIPAHLQRFLFDRNSRAGRPGLRGEKSIGMGLYIVKKLVRLLDGDVTFESTEGKGSTFTIELPKDEFSEASAHQRVDQGRQN